MPNREFTVLHLFSGIGGAALGMQNAEAEYRGIRGEFFTLAGIDCDTEACADFEMLTGAPAVQLDLFSREDYIAFHGHEPPTGWKEVTPADIRAVTGGIAPDVIFSSPPCKGVSGLLPSQKAATTKYQALNNLVLRGLKLTLEAFAYDPPAVILLENVPRITSRGEFLLRQVKSLLSAHGYLFHEGYHDCGELGGLGQHRKRYLLIARLPVKVSSFIYRPPKRRVKSIGEIIGPLPLPDTTKLGPMHRLPRLKWLTWMRLALIPAGGDWRDLEKIAPEQYHLRYTPRGGGSFGVQDWNMPGGTVIGNAAVKGSNAVSIADPRLPQRDSRHPAVYQVVRWNEAGPCVTGTRFGSGAPAVADPRMLLGNNTHNNIYRVEKWEAPSHVITGSTRPAGGAISVADPRVLQHRKAFGNIHRVGKWDEPSPTVTAASRPIAGCVSVADLRLTCHAKNGTLGVQDWNKPGYTVTGALDIYSGPGAVADPRIPENNEQPDPPPVIIALDGTWHRPLTTLELAALQGFPVTMPDSSPLVLAGKSDARWRERIGNAVPPPAAQAIASQILRALLLSMCNAWELSPTAIWVHPVESGTVDWPTIR